MELDTKIISEMEKMIDQLSGVISNKIIQDDQGEIAEIHILADKSRNPKQISRDVQSALTAKFNISIDYKVISVAEIESDGIHKSFGGIKLKSLSYDLEGINGKARVILEKDGISYEGEYGGIHSGNFLKMAFINATIDALNKYTGKENVFMVEDYKVIGLAERRVLVVAIAFINAKHRDLYIGNAVLNDETGAECVNGVLDAVNGILDV